MAGYARLVADYHAKISVWKFKYVGGDINTAKEFSYGKENYFLGNVGSGICFYWL
jgi:hypothetical protein